MNNKLSAIKRIENRVKQIPGAISLAQGIPNFTSHKLIQKAVIEAIEENKVDRYSPIMGLPEFRNIIATTLAKRKMYYNPDSEIIVTAGGIEALAATLLTILEPDDEVIILPPCYGYYDKMVRMAKGKPVAVPLSETVWQLDIEKLKTHITAKTKAIILCSPNNPTGSILETEEIKAIGELALKHNFFVIADDIYENFYYGKKIPMSIATLSHYKEKVIRIVSLSKDFALSGWRIGFVHGTEDVIQQILVTHDNLINCAPVVSQYAAIAALENETIILNEYKEIYTKRRKLMGDYLEKMTKYLSFTWPEGAYYFFPKIKGVKDTEAFCFDLLEKAKVGTVPGDDFGSGGQGHIRICFGKSEKEIEEGMKRMHAYFEEK